MALSRDLAGVFDMSGWIEKKTPLNSNYKVRYHLARQAIQLIFVAVRGDHIVPLNGFEFRGVPIRLFTAMPATENYRVFVHRKLVGNYQMIPLTFSQPEDTYGS